jgi:hypothetical protein
MTEIAARGSQLSPCGAYRYSLTFGWVRAREQLQLLTVCIMHPSMTDGQYDDPVVNKCISLAMRNGYNGLRIVALYARRVAQAADLRTLADPIGPDNQEALETALAGPGAFVCAWGQLRWGGAAQPEAVGRFVTTARQTALSCFGKHTDGTPRSPMHISPTAGLVPWVPPCTAVAQAGG